MLAVALVVPIGAAAGPVCFTGCDSDNDTIPDVLDNCISQPNQDQCDRDLDGYGNHCDADVNNDFVVAIPDFGTFIMAFRDIGSPYAGVVDTNCDGILGIPDFGTFTKSFNGPPGPSGKSCAGVVPCY